MSNEPLTGFLTDKQLATLGVPTGTASMVLADAGDVYAQIGAKPYITQDELAAWAVERWQADQIDRLNTAVAFLRAAKKIAGAG